MLMKCRAYESALKEHENLINLNQVQRVNIDTSITPGVSGNPSSTVPFFHIPAIGHSQGYLKDLLMADVCEFVSETFDQAVAAVIDLEKCFDPSIAIPSEGFNPNLIVTGRDGYFHAYHLLNKMVKRWSNDLITIRNAFSRIPDAFLVDTRKIEYQYEDRLNIVFDVAKYLFTHFDEYKAKKEKCEILSKEYNIKCNNCVRRRHVMLHEKFDESLRALHTTMYNANKEPEMEKFYNSLSVAANPVQSSHERDIENSGNFKIQDVRSLYNPAESGDIYDNPVAGPSGMNLDPLERLDVNEDLNNNEFGLGSTIKCAVRLVAIDAKRLPLDERRKQEYKTNNPRNRKDRCGPHKCHSNSHNKDPKCKFHSDLIETINDIDIESSNDDTFDYDNEKSPSSVGYSEKSDWSEELPKKKRHRYEQPSFTSDDSRSYTLDNGDNLIETLKERLSNKNLSAQERLDFMNKIAEVTKEFTSQDKKLRSGNNY